MLLSLLFALFLFLAPRVPAGAAAAAAARRAVELYLIPHFKLLLSLLIMANAAQLVASSKMFGGAVQQFVHASRSTKTPMRFSVFVPKGACAARPAPVLYYLSGLTCTDENFTHKAGAQRAAAAHNVILVAPDTSPRPSPRTPCAFFEWLDLWRALLTWDFKSPPKRWRSCRTWLTMAIFEN